MALFGCPIFHCGLPYFEPSGLYRARTAQPPCTQENMTTNSKIGSLRMTVVRENRAQNRARKYGNMFNDFFKSTAQKGREYSHWIDLALNSHFEAVISEIDLTKIPFWSNLTFLGSKQRSKKVRKGPAAPKPICLVNNEEEGVELT